MRALYVMSISVSNRPDLSDPEAYCFADSDPTHDAMDNAVSYVHDIVAALVPTSTVTVMNPILIGIVEYDDRPPRPPQDTTGDGQLLKVTVKTGDNTQTTINIATYGGQARYKQQFLNTVTYRLHDWVANAFVGAIAYYFCIVNSNTGAPLNDTTVWRPFRWDSAHTYSIGDYACSTVTVGGVTSDDLTTIHRSVANSNLNNALSDPSWWTPVTLMQFDPYFDAPTWAIRAALANTTGSGRYVTSVFQLSNAKLVLYDQTGVAAYWGRLQ